MTLQPEHAAGTGGALPASDPPPAVGSARSERVLVHAPSGRDAELTCSVLAGEGLYCDLCATCDDLAERLEEGAGMALLGSECLDDDTVELVLRLLDAQPVWSDLPVLVLTRESEDSARIVRALSPVANLTLLERPVWMANLVTAAQAAIRARRRQYQVRELVERLAESDRMKDEFLAMLGHELRNPLNAIASAAAILMETGGRATPERQARMIGRQTRHLSRMVDDLLDFSRLSLGKIELRRERLDLRDAARSAVETLTTAGFDGKHHLEVRLADEPVRVEGDPVRLEQVMANLLQNAVKYTPDGGRLELSVTARDGEAVLSVRDDGVGISPEGLDAIFAPFTQLGTQLRAAGTSTGGLGIGLYLARRLANLHDGRLEARSEGPGKGSEFRFMLPCLDAGSGDGTPEGSSATAGAPVRGSAADGEPAPGVLRVLLVEDTEEGREALRELLSLWGCTVAVAADGEGGVAMALSERPQLALIDIGLPDIDGYEVARRIRESDDGAACRLVALTGYGRPEDRRRALEAGFDQHMVKPIDPARLTELLASVRDGSPE